MGSRHLLAVALVALTPVVDSVRAQGPLYRERWADLHLELLRQAIARESEARDDDTMAEVAALVAKPDPIPFAPAAKALARLRGVACDEAFLLRATLGAFVLPEVVDPESRVEECRSLQVTALLPYPLRVPGAISFELEAVDSTGKQLFATDFGKGAAYDDLRAGEVGAAVPCAEWQDGEYRVRLRTVVDGKQPAASDWTVEHTFFVQRGYQVRSENAQREVASRVEGLPPRERAMLLGLGHEVARAYTGEAFDGRSEAMADLTRLELALANLVASRPLWTGLVGRLPSAMPAAGKEAVGAVLRWPVATDDSRKRPLLLVLGAMPSLDVEAHRPSWPDVRTAKWVERRCGDFGLADDLPVAWLQSPGGLVDYTKSLGVVVENLHSVLPTDGTTIVVAELESAAAVCFAPDLLARLRGLVLVGAGAMSKPMLTDLARLPVLAVPLTGHASGAGLEFTSRAADALRQEGLECGFRLAPARARPWTSGAAGSRAEIAQFVRGLLRKE